MMKKNIFVIISCLISLWSWAQPENPIIEVVDGKKYYVHVVQGGNTLYGLSKLYNTSAEEILLQNPFVSSGLQIGQRIQIPVIQPVAPEEQSKTIKAPATHVVQKSQTLYSISKMYGVSMEDIVKLNPGTEVGLALDQVLQLPSHATIEKPIIQDSTQTKTRITFTDSLIRHTVLPHETLYAISKRFMVPVEDLREINELRNDRIRKGHELLIPVKKEKITKIEVRQVIESPLKKKKDSLDRDLVFRPKEAYNVVYLLPFELDGGGNSLRSISTEFYMGARLALDSLQKLGFKAKVHVLDSPSNTTQLKKLLESDTLKKADLIIGPFTGRSVETVASWAQNNQVRMISPLFAATNILRGNGYVYNAVNSDITMMEGMATYLAQNRSGDKILLIKPDGTDEDLYQAFRQKIIALSTEARPLDLVETSISDMSNHFKKGGNTILVVPSTDKGFSTQFMNQLNKVNYKARPNSIAVFCSKDWFNNDDIRGHYKNKYQFHCASPYDFNYSYESTKTLLKTYRISYNSDLSRFGAQGYDVTLCFIRELFMDQKNTKGVMNEMNIKNTAIGSGFENKTTFILKYEEYEIKQIAVIHD